MTIGASAIGQAAIGASAGGFFALTADDLTTGSPDLGTPAVVCPLGIDSYVKLLLHGDGSNGSTTIIDSGPLGKTFTANGNAQLSTGAPKFGTASMLFDGTGDYVTTPDSADFVLGSDDWTMDCWFKRTGGDGTRRMLFGQGDAANTPSDLSVRVELFNTTNSLSGVVGRGFSPFQVRVTGATAVTDSNWHHCAFVRSGSDLLIFLDGVLDGSGTFPDPVNNSTGSFSVGRAGDWDSFYWVGEIDEFRLSVGMARWTASFTPPVRAYGYCCMPSGLDTGAPVLDTPAASVFYALVAADLTTGSPELGTPAMGFPIDDLVTGPPALDSPVLTVFYALVALDLAPGAPELDAPGLILGLVALDLAPGSPDLDSPALAVTYVALDLTTGAPDLGTPPLSTHYALFAFDFETGSPELGTPGFFVALIAVDLETGAPELDAPACSFVVMPRAEFLIDLGETLLDPIYQSMISVPARVFPVTSGLPAIDLLVINHTNGVVVQFGIGVQTVRPAVDVRVRELNTYGVTREDMTGGQVMLWPDTDREELWDIETVFPRPGIWGEPSGELRFYLMDREPQ